MSGSMWDWGGNKRWRVGNDDYLTTGERTQRLKRPWVVIAPRDSSPARHFSTQPKAMRYAVQMARREAR